MKRIEAIIRHNKLDAVQGALLSIGVRGMTVTEVQGRGEERAPAVTYRGITSEQHFVPRIKIETVVDDDEEDVVIDTIFQGAHTGEVGDGRILVTQLDSVTRIRTGEVEESNSTLADHRREPANVPSLRGPLTSPSSGNWFGPRTFHGADSFAMDYWTKRAGS